MCYNHINFYNYYSVALPLFCTLRLSIWPLQFIPYINRSTNALLPSSGITNKALAKFALADLTDELHSLMIKVVAGWNQFLLISVFALKQRKHHEKKYIHINIHSSHTADLYENQRRTSWSSRGSLLEAAVEDFLKVEDERRGVWVGGSGDKEKEVKNKMSHKIPGSWDETL